MVVDIEEAAVERGFVGSPSFFVDGPDLLLAPEAVPAVAFRDIRPKWWSEKLAVCERVGGGPVGKGETMTAELAVEHVTEGEPRCWCCGASRPASQLVRLGLHSEVRLCLACAHDVHRRARAIEDRRRTGMGVKARRVLRQARVWVIERGWHENRLLGPTLRWLDGHLP